MRGNILTISKGVILMEYGVIAIKAKSDKASLKTLMYQTAQITTRATKANIQIVDCIVTFGSARDVLREVKQIDAKKHFDSLLIYAPSQLCKNQEEYTALEQTLAKDFKIGIRSYRGN